MLKALDSSMLKALDSSQSALKPYTPRTSNQKTLTLTWALLGSGS